MKTDSVHFELERVFDVTELFVEYDKTLVDLLDKHAPWHQVKVRARPAAPRFDAECRAMKVKTRKLEKTYRRQHSVQSEKVWRAQFKNQRELFQRKFIDHWSHAIDESQGDSKVL